MGIIDGSILLTLAEELEHSLIGSSQNSKNSHFLTEYSFLLVLLPSL